MGVEFVMGIYKFSEKYYLHNVRDYRDDDEDDDDGDDDDADDDVDDIVDDADDDDDGDDDDVGRCELHEVSLDHTTSANHK